MKEPADIKLSIKRDAGADRKVRKPGTPVRYKSKDGKEEFVGTVVRHKKDSNIVFIQTLWGIEARSGKYVTRITNNKLSSYQDAWIKSVKQNNQI